MATRAVQRTLSQLQRSNDVLASQLRSLSDDWRTRFEALDTRITRVCDLVCDAQHRAMFADSIEPMRVAFGGSAQSDALWRDVCAVLDASAGGDGEQLAAEPASTAGGGVAPPLEAAYRLALAGNDDLVLMRLIERSGPALHRVSESCAERAGETLVRWLACNRFVDLDIVVLASAMQHNVRFTTRLMAALIDALRLVARHNPAAAKLRAAALLRTHQVDGLAVAPPQDALGEQPHEQ